MFHLFFFLCFSNLCFANYPSYVPPPPPPPPHSSSSQSSPSMFVTSEHISVPSSVTQFCHKKCGGPCEKCCHGTYTDSKYRSWCDDCDDSDKPNCLYLISVIQYICTQATYKISVYGTSQPFCQNNVFPHIMHHKNDDEDMEEELEEYDSEENNYSYNEKSDSSYGDENDHSSYGKKSSYGDENDYSSFSKKSSTYDDSTSKTTSYSKKRDIQQTTLLTGNLLSGSTRKTCLVCSLKKRGVSEESDTHNNDDMSSSSLSLHYDVRKSIPDYELYFCGNPKGAVSWVPQKDYMHGDDDDGYDYEGKYKYYDDFGYGDKYVEYGDYHEYDYGDRNKYGSYDDGYGDKHKYGDEYRGYGYGYDKKYKF